MSSKKVNILGTEYEIIFKDYNDDPIFKTRDLNAYCGGPFEKVIVIGNQSTFFDNGNEKVYPNIEKQLLRHEIIHAFLCESGLDCNSVTVNGSWALNEEMIEWFAIQGEKIYKAWIEADAI